MESEELRRQWRQRQRDSRNKRRAKITALKVRHGCFDCGESHPAVLQFHHLDPNEKVMRIAYMISTSQSEKAIEEEIKKCIVLCLNCHTKRHWHEQREKEAQEMAA